MKIFSGSSNPQLAYKIATELKVSFGKIELRRFANGEARVWIREKVVNDQAVVVQSLSYPPDEHLMEFCLICDALKRLGVGKIIGVIPWLGYCIQDKIFRPGEPLSARVIANILQSSPLDQIITLDLHNETIAGFFDLPMTHLSATQVFIDFFTQKETRIEAIVSPDVGGLKRTTKFAQALNLPLSVINKKRDLATGEVTILGIDDQVKGKRILIVDDFISTGATLIKAAYYLKRRGVSKVYAVVTHHFYVDGVQSEVDDSLLDMLFVSDTIALPKKINSKKLKIISTGKLFAAALKIC